MRSGQKFGVLKNYEKARPQGDFRYAILYLPGVIQVYQVYSSYLTDAEDPVTYQRVIDAEGESERLLQLYLETREKNEFLITELQGKQEKNPGSEPDQDHLEDSGQNPAPDFGHTERIIPGILTLSTCEGNGRVRRVVHYLCVLEIPS